MLRGYCTPTSFAQFACIECSKDLPMQITRLAHLQVAWSAYNLIRVNGRRNSQNYVQDLMHAKWKILILQHPVLKASLQELAAHPAAHFIY